MIPNQINNPNTEIENMIYTGNRTKDFCRSFDPKRFLGIARTAQVPCDTPRRLPEVC